VYGVALDPQGHAVVTGYTRGDLDGNHAGNATDDAFVAKFDPNGNLEWLRQFGVPAVADRGYAIATDDAGSIYVTGYTRGSLAGANQGDKDVIVAKLDSSGNQLWLQQLGSAGEEKGWGVVARGTAVYVAGMTGGALGTQAGANDGFLARFDSGGNRLWLRQFGTAAGEEVWGLTADSAGNAYVAGYSAGDFSGTLAGDKDIIAARFDPDGNLTWRDQVGTTGNDKGAGVALDGAGNLYVAGFSDGDLGSKVGKFDVVLIKYRPGPLREWTRQLGTTEDDGADAFAEFNLYLATHSDAVLLSGLTLGETANQTRIGNGDVFLATVDAEGVNR
jgi:Beta-propeller repeat